MEGQQSASQVQDLWPLFQRGALEFKAGESIRSDGLGG